MGVPPSGRGKQMRAAADAFFVLNAGFGRDDARLLAAPAARIGRLIEAKAPEGAFFMGGVRPRASAAHRNIRRFSRTMFVASSASAVGI